MCIRDRRIGGADLDLDLLCGALTDQQVVLALDEGDDGLIEHSVRIPRKSLGK